MFGYGIKSVYMTDLYTRVFVLAVCDFRCGNCIIQYYLVMVNKSGIH